MTANPLLTNHLPAALRSLGAASHILSLGPDAEIQVLADRIVIRSPAQPGYCWGNCLLFLTPQRDPESQIAQFRADFPQARHVAIFWDDPQAKPDATDAVFARLGFKLAVLDVLARHGPALPAPIPPGIGIRPLTSPADWTAATRLQHETGVEEGDHSADHLPVIEARMAARRRSAEAGQLLWFGAFEGGDLVADAGVILHDRLRRFQAVETRASHRRRGIAAALVSQASRHVDRLGAGLPQLILAGRASDAGRLYRRLGFQPSERILSAIKVDA